MQLFIQMMVVVSFYYCTFYLWRVEPARLEIDTTSEMAKIAHKFNTVYARKHKFTDFYFINFFIVVAVVVLHACINPLSFGLFEVVICVIVPLVYTAAQTSALNVSLEEYASGEYFLIHEKYVKFI